MGLARKRGYAKCCERDHQIEELAAGKLERNRREHETFGPLQHVSRCPNPPAKPGALRCYGFAPGEFPSRVAPMAPRGTSLEATGQELRGSWNSFGAQIPEKLETTRTGAPSPSTLARGVANAAAGFRPAIV
jgi:hypothetical protein